MPLNLILVKTTGSGFSPDEDYLFINQSIVLFDNYQFVDEPVTEVEDYGTVV